MLACYMVPSRAHVEDMVIDRLAAEGNRYHDDDPRQMIWLDLQVDLSAPILADRVMWPLMNSNDLRVREQNLLVHVAYNSLSILLSS